jgi:DNA repair exonuclease SbcCD ATPase subunit
MDQYAHIEAQLRAKHAELTHRLERLKDNLTRRRSADSQEQAQELENAEVVDALGNEARSEISKIARALDQIKNNTVRHLRRLRRDDFRWRGSKRTRSRIAAFAARRPRNRYAAADLAIP